MGQTTPQPPQFSGSLLVVVQPARQQAWPGRHAGPPLQPIMHLPPVQTPGGGHGCWQPPQFFASFSRSLQPVAQHVRLGGHMGCPLHVGVHMPPAQPKPGGQLKPQMPQFFGSSAVSEQPDMQHVKPGMQLGPPLQPALTHIELTHWPPGGQTTSHAPQLFGSLVVSTHTLLQSIRLPGHTILPHVLPVQHAPPMHDVEPGGHTSPQPPQLFRSVFVSTQLVPQQVCPPGQPVI
jgi:hypothetical protein